MDDGRIISDRVWQATSADFPRMKEIARACYSRELYEEEYGDPWLRAMMEAPNCLVLCSDRAFVAIEAYKRAGSGATMARFQMIASVGKDFSAGRELTRMTQECVKWAKQCGAAGVFWQAVTGVDLGPLARSAGAQPTSPSYHLRLA